MGEPTLPASDRTTIAPVRYWSLDFWRGVACLLVVVFHSSYYVTENPATVHTHTSTRLIFFAISRGHVGVPIFFVISGYCITAACDIGWRKQHRASQFFLRRFRRIFPPFWIFTVLVVVAYISLSAAGMSRAFHDSIHPIPEPQSLTPRQWLGNFTLTETWRATLAGEDFWRTLFMNHIWTLCYEEQFYAVCGVVMLAAPSKFFPVMAAITVGVAAFYLSFATATTVPALGFFFDGRWLVFAAGILAYYRLTRATRVTARLIDLGMIGLFVSAFLLHEHFKSGMDGDIFAGTGFAILIVFFHRWDWTLITSAVARPISICGIMCYSLYLVHVPVVKLVSHGMYVAGFTSPLSTLLATIPLCIVASVAVGWIFHLVVERRFLKSLPILPPVRTRGSTVAIGVRTLMPICERSQKDAR
jgi:peptidoglycan/LPS O-acetylase OafA/YrhL